MFFNSYNIYDILPQSTMNKLLANILCSDNATTRLVCSGSLLYAAGYDPMQLNTVSYFFLLYFTKMTCIRKDLDNFNYFSA